MLTDLSDEQKELVHLATVCTAASLFKEGENCRLWVCISIAFFTEGGGVNLQCVVNQGKKWRWIKSKYLNDVVELQYNDVVKLNGKTTATIHCPYTFGGGTLNLYMEVPIPLPSPVHHTTGLLFGEKNTKVEFFEMDMEFLRNHPAAKGVVVKRAGGSVFQLDAEVRKKPTVKKYKLSSLDF